MDDDASSPINGIISLDSKWSESPLQRANSSLIRSPTPSSTLDGIVGNNVLDESLLSTSPLPPLSSSSPSITMLAGGRSSSAADSIETRHRSGAGHGHDDDHNDDVTCRDIPLTLKQTDFVKSSFATDDIDSALLASLSHSDNGGIRLWHTNTGRCVRILVRSFSPTMMPWWWHVWLWWGLIGSRWCPINMSMVTIIINGTCIISSCYTTITIITRYWYAHTCTRTHIIISLLDVWRSSSFARHYYWLSNLSINISIGHDHLELRTRAVYVPIYVRLGLSFVRAIEFVGEVSTVGKGAEPTVCNEDNTTNRCALHTICWWAADRGDVWTIIIDDVRQSRRRFKPSCRFLLQHLRCGSWSNVRSSQSWS